VEELKMLIFNITPQPQLQERYPMFKVEPQTEESKNWLRLHPEYNRDFLDIFYLQGFIFDVEVSSGNVLENGVKQFV
jgi:hypothetical protein